VMSMSVRVCLSLRKDISGTTRAIFTIFSVHVAYGSGSVLLRQVTKSKGDGLVLGFIFSIVQNSIWDPYKND